MNTAHIGMPTSRVDGRAKVTGEAKYAAEYGPPDVLHGYVVSSTIAKGRISRLDTRPALAVAGVVEVFTHENMPSLAWFDRSYRDEVAPPGSPFRPFHDSEIKYSAQPIALVVAESFELARYAATRVVVEYETTPHATDLLKEKPNAYSPKERTGMPLEPPARGNARTAFEKSPVKSEADYLVPVEHHNPMELYATTVIYGDDGTFTVYDKTQGCQNVQGYVCSVFGIPKENLQVISPFVGGAFGSGLRPQYQVFLAVLAAKQLKRSVRVVLTRQQMFSFGHRPTTWQRLAMGASETGNLQAVIHEAVGETSRFEDYSETVLPWSGLLYQCENVAFDHKLVKLDVHTPIDMRAPGAVWGMFALESGMDDLAAQLGMDPIDFRLRNYAEQDQNQGRPFSSKELRECYRQAAEAFGWARRTPQPGLMREGKDLIGWGMAGGCWEAQQQKASAKAVFTVDGVLTVTSATADIGTGTYTIMTQIAAEMLGLPIERVHFRLGDSRLPASPVEGGSWTASTIGSAVKAVCAKVQEQLFQQARNIPNSPLKQETVETVEFVSGEIRSTTDKSLRVSLVEAMRHGKHLAVEAEAAAAPSPLHLKYSRYAHSAVLVEVKVDEDFGTTHVTRIVAAVAGGRILNPKTARSQVLGGLVWGIGSALHEESVLDHQFGRFMNHSLAEYHVPVHADIHDMEVIFVEEKDDIVNPLGAKGLGEIGVVGVAAAISNAIFHATGKRLRSLPMTPERLLSASV